MGKGMTSRGILFLVLALILVAAIILGLKLDNGFSENSIKGPQEIDVESYTLRITGLVVNSTSYTYDEVGDRHQHYEKVVTLNYVEGWSVTVLWEGVLVRDLLAQAEPLANAEVLIFRAYDGTQLLYLSTI